MKTRRHGLVTPVKGLPVPLDLSASPDTCDDPHCCCHTDPSGPWFVERDEPSRAEPPALHTRTPWPLRYGASSLDLRHDGTMPSSAPSMRCFGTGNPLYEEYHDQEWGRPVVGEAALLERLVLEAFQCGLSWSLVLRRRAELREAFACFDPVLLAAYDDVDVERLMTDTRVIRNRRKIEAAIANARATVALHDAGRTLAELIESHRPAVHARPRTFDDMPANTPESKALAKDLVKAGFRFVGPTTVYATMQAIGLVNDHLVGCPAGDEIDAA